MRNILRGLKYFVRRMFLRYRLAIVGKNVPGEYSSIMVIAPHPDDEILGLGGYIIRQIQAEKRVTIVYLTNGEKSLEDIDPFVVAEQRRKLSLQVHIRLGILHDKVRWLQLPDGGIPRLDSYGFSEVVRQLEALLDEFNPDAVFVTHPQDTWPYDHVAAFELVEAAIRNTTFRCDLYGYWVWLWYSMPLKRAALIDWKNVYRAPIHNVIQEKKVLMDLYLKSFSPDGRPWSGVLPKAMLKAFQYPYEVIVRLLIK